MKTILFNKQILQKLNASSEQSFGLIAWAVIIVMLLSGTLAGLAFTYLFGYPFLAGFFLMAIIVGVLDAMLIIPSRNRGMNAIRLIVALVLAGIYALSVDAVLFNTDTQNYWQEQNEIATSALDSSYQVQIKAVEGDISALKAKNDSMYHQLDRWTDRLYTEINSGMNNRASGEGTFAQKWQQMMRADAAKYAVIIAQNDTLIAEYQRTIEQLKSEKHAKITALIAPELRGVSDRLTALHAVIFGSDNPQAKWLYCLWFLLALAIELSVLLLKWRFKPHYEAYLKEETRQKQQQEAMNRYQETIEIEKQKKIILLKQELNAKEEALKQEMEHEERLDKLKKAQAKRKRQRKLDDRNHEEEINHQVRTTTDEEGFSAWRKNGSDTRFE